MCPLNLTLLFKMLYLPPTSLTSSIIGNLENFYYPLSCTFPSYPSENSGTFGFIQQSSMLPLTLRYKLGNVAIFYPLEQLFFRQIICCLKIHTLVQVKQYGLVFFRNFFCIQIPFSYFKLIYFLKKLFILFTLKFIKQNYLCNFP